MEHPQEFSAEEIQRYARHLTLPGFGAEAQSRLSRGRVLVIGAGGLGSPVALYLAAAGVGHITVADGDCVDLSNLQRQVIHATADVGRPKALSAAESMRALNPRIDVCAIPRFLTPDELPAVVADYDFVVEATDSLRMKFMVDQACRFARTAYSYGAIFRYEGQTMTVVPGSVRLTDLFPDGPDAVEQTAARGPLGVVPGVLGTIQAAEAVKYIARVGELLTDRLLRFDLLTMDFRTIRLR